MVMRIWPVAMGLSPRVRGNPARRRRRKMTNGSIPACAGEPCSWTRTPMSQTVYPRVCGGTRYRAPPSCRIKGLSPRVRGNPAHERGRRWPRRSIPACAGEPMMMRTASATAAVYPRVCGGTSLVAFSSTAFSGLSPRVRGNHGLARAIDCHAGSIPACAGEPRIAPAGALPCAVYPRVCGGT